MPVDEARLIRHRSYEDSEAGFREEFLTPVLGGVRTVAVLSLPLGSARSTGWVLCHSFGLEQLHLERLLVRAARSLAAAGYPVFRYHGHGYGDSWGAGDGITLDSHVAAALDAVELMAAPGEGVEAVGVMGPRFGGAVAAIVADRMDLPYMALWEPAVRGSQFMRDFIRAQVFADLVGSGTGQGPTQSEEIRDQLARFGFADIKGFRLTRAAHEGISAMDLSKDLGRFRGRALLLSVSRTESPSPGVSKLAERLRALGAEASVRVLQDRLAPQFGQFQFQTTDGGRSKRDVRAELDAALVRTTVDWAAKRAAQPVPAREEGP